MVEQVLQCTGLKGRQYPLWEPGASGWQLKPAIPTHPLCSEHAATQMFAGSQPTSRHMPDAQSPSTTQVPPNSTPCWPEDADVPAMEVLEAGALVAPIWELTRDTEDEDRSSSTLLLASMVEDAAMVLLVDDPPLLDDAPVEPVGAQAHSTAIHDVIAAAVLAFGCVGKSNPPSSPRLARPARRCHEMTCQAYQLEPAPPPPDLPPPKLPPLEPPPLERPPLLLELLVTTTRGVVRW